MNTSRTASLKVKTVAARSYARCSRAITPATSHCASAPAQEWAARGSFGRYPHAKVHVEKVERHKGAGWRECRAVLEHGVDAAGTPSHDGPGRPSRAQRERNRA